MNAVGAPRSSEAYRASMRMLDRLNAWCVCEKSQPAKSPTGSKYVTYCQRCKGLIKPDAGSAE